MLNRLVYEVQRLYSTSILDTDRTRQLLQALSPDEREDAIRGLLAKGARALKEEK